MNTQQGKDISFLLLFFFVLLASPYFVFAQISSQSVSTQDLQSQIQALLKQIQALQQQVTTLQAELVKEPEKTPLAGETPAPAAEPGAAIQEPEVIPPEFTRSLSRGSSGDDVRKLQEFLAKDKEIYPEGLLTGFFGPLTEVAVKKWQEKYKIESIGVIGPKSIAKLKDLGKGRVQQLLEQGVGAFGVIPPGLLIAPGIQKKVETTATATTTTTPVTATSTTATITPSGTIPAVPATPAQPTSGTGTVTVPATPATPAVPAATSAPNATDTTPPSVTLTGPYLGLSPTCLVLYSASYSDNVAVFGVQKKIDGVNYGPEDTGSALNSSPGFIGGSSGCVGGYLTNGTHTFTMVVRDAAGNITTKSIAISIPFTGTAILFPTTMCAATVMNGYSVPSKSSGESVIAATSSPVTNGTRSASATFTCNNGAFTSGPETANITCNSGYTSVGTQCVVSTGDTPPSVPTNLTATVVSSTLINLSWSASTDNVAVRGYLIYRGGTQIANVTTGASYSDTGLVAATAYSYTVAAYDSADYVSGQSSSVSATTLAASSIPQVQGFTATVSGSSVNLSWQDVTGTYSLAGSPSNLFGSYNIYRGSSADFIPSLTWPNANHIVQGSVLSYTNSNLPAGTYYYKIALQDKNGVVGPASQVVSAVIQPADTTPPVTATTSAASSDRDLAGILKSLSSVLQKLQKALR